MNHSYETASIVEKINELQSIINSLRIENLQLTHNLNTYKKMFEKYKDCIYLKDKYDFFKKINEFNDNINDYKLCIISILNNYKTINNSNSNSDSNNDSNSNSNSDSDSIVIDNLINIINKNNNISDILYKISSHDRLILISLNNYYYEMTEFKDYDEIIIEKLSHIRYIIVFFCKYKMLLIHREVNE